MDLYATRRDSFDCPHVDVARDFNIFNLLLSFYFMYFTWCENVSLGSNITPNSLEFLSRGRI